MLANGRLSLSKPTRRQPAGARLFAKSGSPTSNYETGLNGYAAQIRGSLLIGSCVMVTTKHREPYESRGSRPVVGAPGGENPPGDSSNRERLIATISGPPYPPKTRTPAKSGAATRNTDLKRIKKIARPLSWQNDVTRAKELSGSSGTGMVLSSSAEGNVSKSIRMTSSGNYVAVEAGSIRWSDRGGASSVLAKPLSARCRHDRADKIRGKASWRNIRCRTDDGPLMVLGQT
jgi:hypothetical protein